MIRIHSNGTKDRLFQLMSRVNRLNEQLLSPEKRKTIVDEFVMYADDKLGLEGNIPEIELSYEENRAQDMTSFGHYQPESNKILVVAVNRNLADILRTIAHELIHLKQNKDGKLKPNSGETGSTEENEANSLAGVLLREFGKNNPIIFE
jgi:Zn-dependent peptidase ImmA (M78 family)